MTRTLALLLGLLLLPGAARAQGIKGIPREVAFEGPHAFCQILHQFKLQPLKALSDRAADETILVVFGKTDRLSEILRPVGGLKKFGDAGGAFLIASDYEDNGRL